MKRIHEYENETLETYYALGKGNKFLKAYNVMEEEVILCKVPKDAYKFRKYIDALKFHTHHELSNLLKGFKIYSVRQCVITKQLYQVYDCDVYKHEKHGIMVMGKVVPCGKFDKDGKRI